MLRPHRMGSHIRPVRVSLLRGPSSCLTRRRATRTLALPVKSRATVLLVGLLLAGAAPGAVAEEPSAAQPPAVVRLRRRIHRRSGAEPGRAWSRRPGGMAVATVALNELVGPVVFKAALDRTGETAYQAEAEEIAEGTPG